MVGLMINGCVTIFQFLQKHSECCSTEVMESTREGERLWRGSDGSGCLRLLSF